MDLLQLIWKVVKALVAEVLDTPARDRVYAHVERYECLTVPADDHDLIEWLNVVPGISAVRVSRRAGEGELTGGGLWLVLEYTSRGEAAVPFGPFTDALGRFGYVRGLRFSILGERVRP